MTQKIKAIEGTERVHCMRGFTLAYPVTIDTEPSPEDTDWIDILVYVDVEWNQFYNNDDVVDIIVYAKGPKPYYKKYRIAQRLGATVSDIARWLGHVDDGEIELVKEKSNVPKARLNYWRDYAFEMATKTVEK